MKKSIYILIFLSVIFLIRYRYFIPAFFYEHFVSYRVKLPEDKRFVVRGESTEIPMFIKHVIRLAFPEYTILFNNELKPHLVVKNVYRARHTSIQSELNHRVPYISFSQEKGSLKLRRYRSTGYPLHEFVSFKTLSEGYTYIPFVIYAKKDTSFLDKLTRPKIPLNELESRRDLIYLFSHCVYSRDNFFIIVSKYLNKSDSFGKCLNNQNLRAPGSYNDL